MWKMKVVALDAVIFFFFFCDLRTKTSITLFGSRLDRTILLKGEKKHIPLSPFGKFR